MQHGVCNTVDADVQTLVTDVRQLIDTGRAQLAGVVNSALTLLYWQIGRRINSEVLKGERAGYGKQIVLTLSRQLETEYGRGFNSKNLPPAKPPAPKAPARPKAAEPVLTAEAKAFSRVKKAVSKTGPDRPTKTRSFLRHIGAMLGQGSTAAQIDAIVAKLEKAGVVRVVGDLVLYG